jgi:hypothetical protein
VENVDQDKVELELHSFDLRSLQFFGDYNIIEPELRSSDLHSLQFYGDHNRIETDFNIFKWIKIELKFFKKNHFFKEKYTCIKTENRSVFDSCFSVNRNGAKTAVFRFSVNRVPKPYSLAAFQYMLIGVYVVKIYDVKFRQTLILYWIFKIRNIVRFTKILNCRLKEIVHGHFNYTIPLEWKECLKL